MSLTLLALTLWLALTAPADPVRVEDLDGFPSEHECDDMLAWYKIRADWLEAQVDLHGADHWWTAEFQPAIEDNAQRREAWRLLAEAQQQRRIMRGISNPEYAGRLCRESLADLADLRRAIGGREYELRRLPGPIDPRFQRR